MAPKRKTRSRKRAAAKQKWMLAFAGLFLLFAALITVGERLGIPYLPTWEELYVRAGLKEAPVESFDSLTVAFLDVGQGDAVVLTAGEDTVLIDGGEAEYSAVLLQYLDSSGITELDYVFATHPHSDHIGGLPAVLRNIPAAHVVMPELAEAMLPATQIYYDLLAAVSDTGAEGRYAQVGQTYPLGEGTLRVLAPINADKNLNNCSLVLRLEYGNRAFLFTGDMESGEEEDLLDSTSNLKADVLKIGHHGSDASSSDDFLSAVSPAYGIISCGAGNPYGHPGNALLQRLFYHRVTVYRTDQLGTVVCKTDGNTLDFSFEKEMAA